MFLAGILGARVWGATAILTMMITRPRSTSTTRTGIPLLPKGKERGVMP
jgi:hypothetical protein